MKKRICVLQVTPQAPDPVHLELFANHPECDFYFVTHDAPHPDALKFCPNTRWSETRNTLVELIPKEYDYYAFVDYDYILHPQGELSPLEQMLCDLEEFEPAVLTYYPGQGIHSPYSGNEIYRKSKDYSVIPFSHAAFKIVHHSLLNWFFPMVTQFDGDFSSCHLFNILEIPFLKNVVFSHNMIYDNRESNEDSPHNRNKLLSHSGMQKMWAWIMPAFRKMNIINLYCTNPQSKYDSLIVKKAFMDIFEKKNIFPKKSLKDVNYLQYERISKFFDLSHPHFSSKFIEGKK